MYTFRDIRRSPSVGSGTGAPIHRPEGISLLERDRLLTIRQVAHQLGLPLFTAREWSRKGLFPVVRIGRRVFVRAVVLHRWIRKHEHGG
jgi:excisionase family DNA binding protein